MGSVSSLSLFKRSNGIWYINYLENGRRRWKTTRCTNKCDALRTITEFKELIKEKPKAKFLQQFRDEFLDYAETTFAEGTNHIYAVCLRNLLTIAGNIPLTALTPQHIDKYKAERVKHVKPVTVNVELRSLRTMMYVALRWKLIEENPFARIQLFRVPEIAPAFFTRDEFKLLISTIEEDWLRNIVIFAALTGMRRGEITSLTWDKVDFTRKVINIESNTVYKVKAGKRRTIPMNEFVFQLLMKEYGHYSSPYVFTQLGVPLLGNWITHKFKRYVRQLGFDKRLKFHSLRASFASWLVMGGSPIYSVAKLLGHSDVSITTSHYAHLAPDNMHVEVNRLSF